MTGVTPAMISIAVPGRPVAFARAARGIGHSYTPEPQSSYMAALGYAARAAMAKAGYSVIRGPVEMIYRATYAYPDSWPSKKRDKIIFKTSAPDADNLVKIVGDAIQYIVYANDAQIVRIDAEKRYGHVEGVVVTIQEIDGSAA